MRISIHATIKSERLIALAGIYIGEVKREAGADPASGLGLFVREAHAPRQEIQTVVLKEQADEFKRWYMGGLNRAHIIFGTPDACIATHPSGHVRHAGGHPGDRVPQKRER